MLKFEKKKSVAKRLNKFLLFCVSFFFGKASFRTLYLPVYTAWRSRRLSSSRTPCEDLQSCTNHYRCVQSPSLILATSSGQRLFCCVLCLCMQGRLILQYSLLKWDILLAPGKTMQPSSTLAANVVYTVFYRVRINYRSISLRHNLSRKCRKIVKFASITHSERNIWNGPIVATAISRKKA